MFLLQAFFQQGLSIVRFDQRSRKSHLPRTGFLALSLLEILLEVLLVLAVFPSSLLAIGLWQISFLLGCSRQLGFHGESFRTSPFLFVVEMNTGIQTVHE